MHVGWNARLRRQRSQLDWLPVQNPENQNLENSELGEAIGEMTHSSSVLVAYKLRHPIHSIIRFASFLPSSHCQMEFNCLQTFTNQTPVYMNSPPLSKPHIQHLLSAG